MKTIYISFLIALVLLGSCQSELTTTNVNPNNLEVPNVPSLTSNVIVSEFWNNTNQAWTLGNAMSQLVVFSASYYNVAGARFAPINNSAYWSTCYSNARDAATIVTQAKKQNNPGNQAVGLALQAYAFSQLTDCWGDIPYTQALRGASANYLAPYDDQQSIYTNAGTGLLAKLATADSLLTANPSAVISGDPLYGGNALKWRKFINGLRLRLLIRISAKQDVSAAMQSVLNEGVLFQNSGESAALKLTTALPWLFPSYTDRAGDFSIKVLDSILYKFYANTGDRDRLTLFFAQSPNVIGTPAFSFTNYKGIPQVVDASSSQAATASQFAKTLSPTSTYVSSPLNFSRIITYAEVQFILAEAALKGYIPGGIAQATTYYSNGVLGAYAEVGLPAADATAYLSANPLSADPTNTYAVAMNQIIMQKWALNLNNGFEGWLEQRRTGIPVFDLTANQNNGSVAMKFLYPPDEEFVNSINYNNEMKKIQGGKDNANYRAWW
ncbi:MAG: SusD/RagB family nutrient-binding outer membrane lipoprotein [Bacteroidetes bacterium]|nr:SusD/RagB family nutrient-binding outer membrane lipoprotein [Bacteroidota bacterium]